MSEPVSVIGLGKLGLPLAACFATRLPVLGVDIDPAVAESVADFTGGLAIGGACFPRDTVAFRAVGARTGAGAPLLGAAELVNAAQNDRLFDIVRACRPQTVGVLGIAFRPDTPVTDASPSVELVRRLRSAGIAVVAYDPLSREDLGSGVEWAGTIAECLNQCDVAVVTHRSAGLKRAIETHVAHGPLTIVDCWRIVDPSRVGLSVRVLPMGRHVQWTSSPT